MCLTKNNDKIPHKFSVVFTGSSPSLFKSKCSVLKWMCEHVDIINLSTFQSKVKMGHSSQRDTILTDHVHDGESIALVDVLNEYAW